MKKVITRKVLILTLSLGIFMSGTILNASSITKTLKAAYNNIKVSYNGEIKSLSIEPFLVNGTTYVPLRAIGELMGAHVTWANNTVSIENQGTAATSSEQALASKNFEIASLQQQLASAKAELETYKTTTTPASGESNLTTSAVSTTLNQIESDYSDDYDVDWDFDLGITSSRLQLTVYYDSNDEDFDDMTESERQAFIKNICYDIADNHQGAEIRGTLEDSRRDTEIADFIYTASGSFTYDTEDTYTLNDFEDELENDYDTINADSFDIPINSIALDEDENELRVTIITDLTPEGYDYIDEWNNLSATDETYLEDLLDDMSSDIEDEFSSYDEISFMIKDTYSGTIASYEDGYLNTYDVSAE